MPKETVCRNQVKWWTQVKPSPTLNRLSTMIKLMIPNNNGGKAKEEERMTKCQNLIPQNKKMLKFPAMGFPVI